MSLFPSYSSTPGLERFPLGDQKRIYQETLIKLRKDDPEFAQRMDRFSRRSIWITMGFVAGSAVLNGLAQRKMISDTVYLPILGILSLAYLVAFLKAVQKNQQFLNEHVAAVLPGDEKEG